MTNLREFDRVELERLRRVQRSHDADRLTDRELSQRVALSGVRRPVPAGRRALRAMALAAAASSLALGALATSGALSVHALFGETESANARPSTAGQVERASGPSTLPRPVLTQEPAREPPVSESPAVGSSSPREVEPTTKLSAPPTLRDQRALEVVDAEVAQNAVGAWTRAADALRQGDHSAAEQALQELSRSADPATRDAALLAQAELDLGAGHSERARLALGWLAERGATPFVRTRARQILAEKK